MQAVQIRNNINIENNNIYSSNSTEYKHNIHIGLVYIRLTVLRYVTSKRSVTTCAHTTRRFSSTLSSLNFELSKQNTPRGVKTVSEFLVVIRFRRTLPTPSFFFKPLIYPVGESIVDISAGGDISALSRHFCQVSSPATWLACSKRVR